MSLKRVELPVPKEIGWENRLLKTEKGAVKSCSYNVRLILENDPRWEGVLGYCEFSYQVMKLRDPPLRNASRGEWDDGDTASLRHWVAECFEVEPKTSDVIDAVLAAARAQPFHPVKDYLNSLEWDGTQRLPLWLNTYLGADDLMDDEKDEARRIAYLQAVGVKWMVAAVARVMQPPVKVDNVLILEGVQGMGKSTVFGILGGEWFTDSHFNIGDKDGMQFLRGTWIVELAELDSLNKVEATRAKQFFGSAKDRYRASFGRTVQEWPRQCVFAGTTNQDSYLKDPTGGRRYWPVSCNEIDFDLLRADRDQLWAEAVHRYRQGEIWYVAADERHLFEAEQEERFNPDAWEAIISNWLDDYIAEPRAPGVQVMVTAGDVFTEALRMDAAHMRPPEQQRVGQIMGRLGWRKRRRGARGSRIYGWIPPGGV